MNQKEVYQIQIAIQNIKYQKIQINPSTSISFPPYPSTSKNNLPNFTTNPAIAKTPYYTPNFSKKKAIPS
jgi:hypothetical protein